MTNGTSLRNRSPHRARSLDRAGQWSPAYLNSYAWYDANLGGSSTQITDSSANARAAITNGAGSNAAQWLPYTVPSLHLEAATAGTNSLSCTAPAGTASYSAAPRDGGAPTTGAASAGAFTFTTAGNWASVSLLNAGATEIAKFSAASSTQSGHTDTYGVAWTVNPGTSGRKAVVQSPAANSAESLFLYGPDDYQTVPDAAIPSFGTNNVGSIYTIVRTWGSGTDYLFGNLTAGVGPGIQSAHLGGSSVLYVSASDGTNTSVQTMAWPTDGKRAVVGVHFTATHMYISVNGVDSAAVTRPTGSINSSAGFVLGGYVGTVGSGDHEGRALLTLNSAPSANVSAQLVSYYRGGL